jgi:hypothetical protein
VFLLGNQLRKISVKIADQFMKNNKCTEDESPKFERKIVLLRPLKSFFFLLIKKINQEGTTVVT